MAPNQACSQKAGEDGRAVMGPLQGLDLPPSPGDGGLALLQRQSPPGAAGLEGEGVGRGGTKGRGRGTQARWALVYREYVSPVNVIAVLDATHRLRILSNPLCYHPYQSQYPSDLSHSH